MKYLLISLIIISLLLIALFVKAQFKNGPSVQINNIYFRAEIAKTDQEKAVGMAKYKKIDNNFAMVFSFAKPDYYTFWMKDMKFSIDIIYIRQNRVLQIFSNVPKPKNENDILKVIKPKEAADTVVEINSGLSRRYYFKKGDQVEINY